MKEKAVVFDIDGTLADNEHRKHHLDSNDWDSFFDAMIGDSLKKPVANLLKMYHHNGYKIILVTGRPDSHEHDTMMWLRTHGILPLIEGMLMREAGNTDPDEDVKKEIFTQKIAPNYNVEVVVDDRQKVVDMWRGIGLTCFQVARGDF